MKKYRVEMSEWVNGSGFSYKTTIDNIDDKMTAEEYLEAVASNGAGYAPDDDGNLYFEVIDNDTDEVIGDGAWGKEDQDD